MEGHRGVIAVIFGLSRLLCDMTLSDVTNQMPDVRKSNATGEGECIRFIYMTICLLWQI